MSLVCNCTRVISRKSPGFAPHPKDVKRVKSRKWDCPSCGQDRKRKLASMCDTAIVTRMLTLTFDQPMCAMMPAHQSPGERSTFFPDMTVAGPGRHRRCDPITHVYFHASSSSWRWRILPSCDHCCRYVSRLFRLFILKLRYTWPELEYLHVRETHKSGAMHLHVAVVGIPAVITRTSKGGRRVKAAWQALGGGFVDVGRHGEKAGASAGWYVGKYLAKVQDEPCARGFRRWSRSASFAPGIRMVDDHVPGSWVDEGAPISVGGWVHPDGSEWRARWFPEWEQVVTEARLDDRTAKCRILPLLERYREAWVAAGRTEAAVALVLDPPAAAPVWEALALGL